MQVLWEKNTKVITYDRNARRRKVKRNRRNIWNTNAENFPKVMSKTKAQIQEAQRIPSRLIPRKLHLDISFSNYRNQKVKENPESSQRKKTPYLHKEEKKVGITSDFSRTHATGREWNDIL